MSQILYLQSGGTTPEQKMFKYHSGEIETDRLIKAMAINLDDYLEKQNWSRKKKQRFVSSINRFIEGIKNGNITEMSPTGRFTDTRGVAGGGVSNTTGTRRFRDDQEGAAFIKWVLKSQDPYQKPAEPEKEKFEINKLFAKQFNKDNFHIDSDKLDVKSLQTIPRNKQLQLIFNTLRNIDSDDWGVYESKDAYLTAVEEALGEINKKIEKQRGRLNKQDVVSPLVRLGLTPGFLDYMGNQNTAPTQQQSVSDDDWYKSQPSYNLGNFLNSADFTKGLNQLHITRADYIPRVMSHLNTLSPEQYYTAIADAYAIPWVQNGQAQSANTNNMVIGTVLQDLIQDPNQTYLKKMNDETYVIPSSKSTIGNIETVIVYNPNKNSIQRVPTSYVPSQLLGESTKIRWNQQGGVLKADGGTKLDNNIAELLKKLSTTPNYDTFEAGDDLFKAVKADNKWTLVRATPSTNKRVPETDEYDSEGDASELEQQGFYQQATNRLMENPKEGEKYFRKILTLATDAYKNKINNLIFKNGTYDHAAAKEYLKNHGAYDKEQGIIHARPQLKGYRVWDGNEYRYGNKQDLLNLGYELDSNAAPEAIDENNPYVYAYTMKQKAEMPKPSAPIPAPKSEPSEVDAGLKGKKGKNFFDRLKGAAPSILSFAGTMSRFFNNNNANKKLLNEALKQKPLEISPRRFERDIYGDYASLSAGENAAAKIFSSTAVPMTSNAKIEADRKLKALTAAEDARWKGQVANSEAIRNTHEAALAQAKENAYNETDTSNTNIRSRWANEEYKRNARMGYINQKAQNFNTLSQELQQQALGRINEKRQVEEAALNQYLDAKYTNNPEMQALKVQYSNAVAADDTKKQTELLAQMQQLALQNNDNRMIEYLKEIAKIRGITISDQYLKRGTGSAKKVEQNKNGGRISDAARIKIAKIKDTLDRDKLFQKNVSESIKENNKKLNSLSNTMQKLVMAILK